jgi:hypothetical protein
MPGYGMESSNHATLMSRSPVAAALLVLVSAACLAPGGGLPAPMPAPAAEQPLAWFPYGEVWSASPDMLIDVDGVGYALPGVLTRLEVLGGDSTGLRVRCAGCPGELEGVVDPAHVLHSAESPAAAANGDLAGFALAIREAALRRDVDALRPVMSRTFTFSFGAWGGPVEAIAAWEREGYRALDHLPGVLDRGISTRDGRIWAAPPEYLHQDEFHGYRTGFRREGGRWQWIFLVRGE